MNQHGQPYQPHQNQQYPPQQQYPPHPQYEQHPYQQYPPQQGYRPHPQQIPPQPPKKKRRGVWIALGIVAGLVVIGAAVGGQGESDAEAKDKAPAAEGAKEAKGGGTEQKAADEKPAAEPESEPKSKPKSKSKSKPKGPKTYGDGDYVVGEDIPAGTYQSAGASSDVFDFCSVTTEPPSETKMPQLKSANKGERIIITLTKADGTVTVQGCKPLTRR
ncbi:hypothetical protein [Streptomyces sp. NPDC048172]|uniref:hypothetical protein n=1 Tax=Streptomyces sp. NPDC048172 TaxID=3365505 RepID=UPI0037123EA9